MQIKSIEYLDYYISATSYYTITDTSHTVQVEWQASTRAGANNGSLKLTIDGQLKQTLSGKDNDTRQVDYLRLGAVAGIDSSTRGTLYLDDFRSWDPTAAVQAEFRYDGDGRRVQSVVNGVTTAFVGQYFEWTGSTSTMKKVYYFGAQRVAVRDGNGTGTTGLSWLITDHLGSTTITLDAAGAKNAEKRYKPWGEERFTFGTLPTQYTYTGQYSHTAQFGLLFYNARWYDPLLGRFNSPDSIIPEASQGTQAWDRYAGMNNNPVKYNDPSGSDVGCGGRDLSECAPIKVASNDCLPGLSCPVPTPTNANSSLPTSTATPPPSQTPTLTPSPSLTSTKSPTPTDIDFYLQPTKIPGRTISLNIKNSIDKFIESFDLLNTDPDPLTSLGWDFLTPVEGFIPPKTLETIRIGLHFIATLSNISEKINPSLLQPVPLLNQPVPSLP